MHGDYLFETGVKMPDWRLTTYVGPPYFHTTFGVTSIYIKCRVLIYIIFYSYIILFAHHICGAFSSVLLFYIFFLVLLLVFQYLLHKDGIFKLPIKIGYSDSSFSLLSSSRT